MHGIIHSELKKYVETKYPTGVSTAVLRKAGLANKIYLTIGTYPDEGVTSIIEAVSDITATSAEQIMEDFGEFIAPTLMDMYKALIKPEWRTLDLLLNTEETIHRVVKVNHPGAQPPRLEFRQEGPTGLKFFYSSPRHMSAVAKGIMKGVAKHYGETLTIQEITNSDSSCEMSITIT